MQPYSDCPLTLPYPVPNTRYLKLGINESGDEKGAECLKLPFNSSHFSATPQIVGAPLKIAAKPEFCPISTPIST